MYSGITFWNYCPVCGQNMQTKVQYPTCGNIQVCTLGPNNSISVDVNNATPCPYGLSSLSVEVEPCLMQSAFQFDNDMRIIIYTGPQGIATFICDHEWKPRPKPYAECNGYGPHNTATEYHLAIRAMHKKEHFVKEYSTEIKNKRDGQ